MEKTTARLQLKVEEFERRWRTITHNKSDIYLCGINKKFHKKQPWRHSWFPGDDYC